MRNGCLSTFFSGTIEAITESLSPILFELLSGDLPPGLALTSAGKVATISGIPTQVGTYRFWITARLVTLEKASREYVINIATISNSSLPAGTVGVNYNQQMAVSGPTTGNEVWSVTSGTLPPGVTLDADTGILSGPPSIAGNYTFIICFSNEL